ncbi:MAG: hypothetical protein ACN4GW_10160 [Desulforhopalus sp.]
MDSTLHITSGDVAGESLIRSGLPGEVFVWHDILYDGPRNTGWPSDATLSARALFLERTTGGGLAQEGILATLHHQYRKMREACGYDHIVLWFDGCLFDQSMLAHILTCLVHTGANNVELLCIDSFPGIEPFHGLGQLLPAQLASLYDDRQQVTLSQFQFAARVDQAFATQDVGLLTALSLLTDSPLPRIPATVKRWLLELPDPATGLGRLEELTFKAVRCGCEKPWDIFKFVAAADTPPQFWGDIILWAKINGLAECDPPLLLIEGPAKRLPQWESNLSLNDFRITAL